MQIERVIFETPAVKVGVLRCPEHHPNFKEPRPTEFSQSLQEEIVYRAEEDIGRHFREPFSIADVAKEAGASPFHLCRLFRRHRKVALHARCNELRLRPALELVMDTNVDLTEVSLASGFSSHSHFTWAFKRQFGITPSSIRSCP
jgi:AraC family transcriptional regulator